MKKLEAKPGTGGGGRRSDGQRGIALLVVLTLVVMFTAFVVDFSYSSRVRYIMASRARDAAKAEYLAKSGLRMYQLLLIMGDGYQDAISKKLGNASNSPFGALQAIMGSGSMVVRLIPMLDTGLLRMLTGAGSAGPDEAAAPAAAGDIKGPARVADDAPVSQGSFLDFEGDFSVSAKEEATKIGLQSLAKFQKLDSGPALLLLQTLKRDEYQPLFRAANITPEELVSNIVDWGDPNGERANGQGYEDNLYNKGVDPFNSKNSPFDSLAEMHLVAGMTDDLYNIVVPLVSPWSDAEGISLPLTGENGRSNLCGLIGLGLGRTPTAADCEKWWTDYQNATILAPPNDETGFLPVLAGMRLGTINEQPIKDAITDEKKRPKQFTLTATGRVGDVQRSVQVVLDIGHNKLAGGRILYWRVE